MRSANTGVLRVCRSNPQGLSLAAGTIVEWLASAYDLAHAQARYWTLRISGVSTSFDLFLLNTSPGKVSR
jgi:hypothetical protein